MMISIVGDDVVDCFHVVVHEDNINRDVAWLRMLINNHNFCIIILLNTFCDGIYPKSGMQRPIKGDDECRGQYYSHAMM